MNADQYQYERAEDNGMAEFYQARTVFALGIAGEAGEVADYMKTVIGHGEQLDKTKLTDELGDVLWYVSQLAHIHGIAMSEIMEHNTAKLRERYPHGFSGDLPHWSERVKMPERKFTPQYFTRKPTPEDGQYIWVAHPDRNGYCKTWAIARTSDVERQWHYNPGGTVWMHESAFVATVPTSAAEMTRQGFTVRGMPSTMKVTTETALDPGEFVIKGSDLHRKNREWLVWGIGSNDPMRKPKPKYLTRKPIPEDGERIWVSWPDAGTEYKLWLLLTAKEIADNWEAHEPTIRWMHEWSLPSIKKEQQ